MEKVKYFERNLKGIDYVVGDLHGCLDEFDLLLQHIGFNFNIDRMFSVGDLVDRGPHSLKCAKLIRESWFHSVRGNHEQLMIDSLLGEYSQYNGTYNNWLINGGQWSLLEDELDLKEVSKELDELPLVIVIDKNGKRINIAHAELYRNKNRDFVTDADIDNWNFDHINENNIIWGRGLIGSKAFNKEINPSLSTTFVGHTPVEEEIDLLNHRFIDLGACFWHKQRYEKAKLCIVRINDNKSFLLNMKDLVITETN